MSDLIDRQAAIEAVEESRRLNHHQDGKAACAHEHEHRHFLKLLRDLPPAQPEHPKGKWIPVTRIYKATEDEFPGMHIEWVDSTEPDEIDGLRCSECGTVYDFTEARNWCSECGADMMGERDGKV